MPEAERELAEFIDLKAERMRLARQVSGLEAEIKKLSEKLDNPDFVARAPEEVVGENRERLETAQAAKRRLDVVLSRFS
ncbi:hypothetical protein ACFSOZ_17685 [Mesorhizobium newzealandense]|uniref:Valyl-tRNA synthetase tRNA-binding arm domain-containing protein n=1 Tax=Mesorhizobium newzealandense TaxID=1300302 RepID=A0ABW4UD56_9HYPH